VERPHCANARRFRRALTNLHWRTNPTRWAGFARVDTLSRSLPDRLHTEWCYATLSRWAGGDPTAMYAAPTHHFGRDVPQTARIGVSGDACASGAGLISRPVGDIKGAAAFPMRRTVIVG